MFVKYFMFFQELMEVISMERSPPMMLTGHKMPSYPSLRDETALPIVAL